MGIIDLKDCIDVASKRKNAELVLKNAKIVNVFSHEIEIGDVAVENGKIVGIGQYTGENEINLSGKYLCPGFIDAHLHIESTMVSPKEFVKAVLPKGTTTVIADPHEIANICGLNGINYILDETEETPLDVYIMLPSCVPSTCFETSGAVLSAEELKKLINHNRVIGLGEMMDYPGVTNADREVLNKLELFNGKVIDGHSPGISKYDLNAYCTAGIGTDHECETIEEMHEKIKRGMYVLIREGTAARNLEALVKGVNNYNSRWCLFCTDDKHPEDIINRGHINNNIKMAVKLGMDPITAIQMATINAAHCYGIKRTGAVAPGYKADLVVLDNLVDIEPSMVIKSGIIVAKNGELSNNSTGRASDNNNTESYYNTVIDTIKIKELVENSFEIKIEGNTADVIKLLPHSIITKHVKRNVKVNGSGIFVFESNKDISKMSVIERHKATGNIGIGLVEGFGIKNGAIASTVAHDSHNIIVIGDNDQDMKLAVERVISLNGGIALVSNGKVLNELALPIGGLMSELSIDVVANTVENMVETAYCKLHVSKEYDPFMTLAFMALPVIPEIKLTDKGLFDVVNFKFIEQ